MLTRGGTGPDVHNGVMNMTLLMKSLLLSALLVAPSPAVGFSAPVQGPGAGPDDGIEIPFELGDRGHILVDVRVDGHGPVPFALDTGAGRTMLNRSRLGTLDLEERPSGQTVQRAHQTSGMGLVDVGAFSMGEASFGSLELGTIDLADVEGGDTTLFGVLGFDILGRFDISLDFEDGIVVLYPRAEDVGGCSVCEGELSVPFDLAQGTHIRFEVTISDQPISVILDTGSGRTGMNRLAAEAIGVELPPTMPGGHAPALRVGEIHMGEGSLARDVIVGVIDLPVFQALGVADGPAMLMGTGTLAGRRVGISYGLGRISVR